VVVCSLFVGISRRGQGTDIWLINQRKQAPERRPDETEGTSCLPHMHASLSQPPRSSSGLIAGVSRWMVSRRVAACLGSWVRCTLKSSLLSRGVCRVWCVRNKKSNRHTQKAGCAARAAAIDSIPRSLTQFPWLQTAAQVFDSLRVRCRLAHAMKDLQHGSDLGPREESSVIGHGSPSTTTCEKLLHGVCEERTDEWFVLFCESSSSY
jgi:hypothetical protein